MVVVDPFANAPLRVSPAHPVMSAYAFIAVLTKWPKLTALQRFSVAFCDAVQSVDASRMHAPPRHCIRLVVYGSAERSRRSPKHRRAFHCTEREREREREEEEEEEEREKSEQKNTRQQRTKTSEQECQHRRSEILLTRRTRVSVRLTDDREQEVGETGDHPEAGADVEQQLRVDANHRDREGEREGERRSERGERQTTADERTRERGQQQARLLLELKSNQLPPGRSAHAAASSHMSLPSGLASSLHASC
jgi:hypothetical protein